ncbi:protein HID1 [Ischnura elegans]|uniref:protein HID1 n=1 Tax=Ischnura elegans TaxID=197161 RepID=UPI001ED8A5A9|nr:protein HID1 [Ischnura elegans]
MGNTDSKLNFRKAVIQLTSKTQPVEADDESFWERLWGCGIEGSGGPLSPADVFALVPASEVRSLREENPQTLATLLYKAVQRLVRAVHSSCRTHTEQDTVLNCVRLLTRILPHVFEDSDWRGFFWSGLPTPSGRSATDDGEEEDSVPLAQSLVDAICDLLFCPDFTVAAGRRVGPDKAEDLQNLDSCEYIWESGVGFASSPPRLAQHDANRTELLKLLLTCFGETMYLPPPRHSTPRETSSSPDCSRGTPVSTCGPAALRNRWVRLFTCGSNRHALPAFTSLLNVVCAYDPSASPLPYNHLLFSDTREPLADTCLQCLVVCLDPYYCAQPNCRCSMGGCTGSFSEDGSSRKEQGEVRSHGGCCEDNLFLNYLSRIHREEDFAFMLKGFARLLNNPLAQTYLPNSTRKVHFHQELLVLFWKACDYNKKFLYYVLKSSDVLDILVPILYHLNDARADQSRVGLMHIGVFILLLLSGERNFGVRLNKPYTATVPMDVPVFTGTHADLLITVFHKIITTGHQRLQPLFDCLLTILVNVSPYLKTISMVGSTKLVHLLEAFATPWFLFSSPSHHHLLFFLLEIFNNIIQYQFDGNSNLVYTIIRKRQVFHALASLPSDPTSISRSLTRSNTMSRSSSSTNVSSSPPVPHSSSAPVTHPRKQRSPTSPVTTPTMDGDSVPLPQVNEDGEVRNVDESMEGSIPAAPAEPGTLKATLADTPGIENMTERESAHPSASQLKELTDGKIEDLELDSGQSEITSNSSLPKPSIDIDDTSAKKPSVGESSATPFRRNASQRHSIRQRETHSLGGGAGGGGDGSGGGPWVATPEWVQSWKSKLPLQTIMRLLQVLVPQVEKICIDKGLTDEGEILRFLQHGTLVGLLPVPHPILIRKYQANRGTTAWFRTYVWGVIYLRNVDPPIWYDTDVKLFEIQRV